MDVDEQIIKEVVQHVLSVTRPDRIILFGSAAAGHLTPDSDIDLLILEPIPRNTREESVRIGNALRGLGYPFDIMVMATVRFEESKNIIGGLAYPANKYGKVIYEAS
ncbi:MAG: nucleotidyltransferase domain-containing protein [Candidatus Neomarinimicrobiota bacterium]